MKRDMKIMLRDAFEAPAPERKKEFIKKMGKPRISTFSFMLLQISYIRKRVWAASAGVLVFAVICANQIGRDAIWGISAMMPFIALCAVAENARSAVHQMAELEIASRFSMKSIILARMGIIGLLHFAIFCALTLFAGKSALFPFWQAGIYLLVPYLLAAVPELAAVRKIHGKEAVYTCMGISVIVSCLSLTAKFSYPQIYGEKQIIWWVVLLVFLAIRLGKEYKKTIEQVEELVWN